MDCRRATELISAAALGELRGGRRAGFEKHVSACSRCRAELGRARWVLRLVDALMSAFARPERRRRRPKSRRVVV